MPVAIREFTGQQQSAALSFSSVLSLPSLLDALPGQLAKGLGTRAN